MDINTQTEVTNTDETVALEANTTTEVQVGPLSEDAALAILSSNGNNIVGEETTETAPNVEEQEVPQEIDLSDIDLTEFGITEDPTEIIETTNPTTETAPNVEANQMQELINKIDGLSNNNTNQVPEMPEEEAIAIKELFGKFQQMGLIPENAGLSEEDRALLEHAKQMKETLDTEQKNRELEAAHNNKVSSLDEFSKSLEASIPGYSSEFMVQVVSQIREKNPQAAQDILDNPSKLVNLWAKVGARAQPQTTKTNIINPSNNPITNNSELANRVMSGKATEWEEGDLLRRL